MWSWLSFGGPWPRRFPGEQGQLGDSAVSWGVASARACAGRWGVACVTGRGVWHNRWHHGERRTSEPGPAGAALRAGRGCGLGVQLPGLRDAARAPGPAGRLREPHAERHRGPGPALLGARGRRGAAAGLTPQPGGDRGGAAAGAAWPGGAARPRGARALPYAALRALRLRAVPALPRAPARGGALPSAAHLPRRDGARGECAGGAQVSTQVSRRPQWRGRRGLPPPVPGGLEPRAPPPSTLRALLLQAGTLVSHLCAGHHCPSLRPLLPSLAVTCPDYPSDPLCASQHVACLASFSAGQGTLS